MSQNQNQKQKQKFTTNHCEHSYFDKSNEHSSSTPVVCFEKLVCPICRHCGKHCPSHMMLRQGVKERAAEQMAGLE